MGKRSARSDFPLPTGLSALHELSGTYFKKKPFVSYGQRIASIQSIRKERSPWRRWEAAGLVLNAVLYVGVPLWLLGPWATLLFVAVHQAVAGLYLGLVFAPNHTGNGRSWMRRACSIPCGRRCSPRAM